MTKSMVVMNEMAARQSNSTEPMAVATANSIKPKRRAMAEVTDMTAAN